MASPKSTVNSDGTVTVIYPDGRIEKWSADRRTIIDEQGPDARRAQAFFTGGQTLADTLRELEEFDSSPYGQRYNERLRQVAERTKTTEDRDYDLRRTGQRDDLDYRNRSLDQSGDQFNRSLAQSGEQFNKSLEQRIREADMQHSLSQGTLGLNYLQARASLSGPGDWGEALDLQAGARQRQDVPIFFQRLADNVQSPGFTGVGGVPKALSMQSMANSMTAGGGASQADPRVKQASDILKAAGISEESGWDEKDISALNLVGQVLKQGANKSVQAWDTSSGDAQKGFLSLAGKLGQSPSAWTEGIERARWGGAGVGSRA